jgi:hypothetical protein
MALCEVINCRLANKKDGIAEWVKLAKIFHRDIINRFVTVKLKNVI